MSTLPREGNNGNHGDGPMVPSQLYRSYADIYRRLALVSYYDPTSDAQAADDAIRNLAFCITYHVWKPGSTTYKKSVHFRLHSKWLIKMDLHDTDSTHVCVLIRHFFPFLHFLPIIPAALTLLLITTAVWTGHHAISEI